MHVRRLLVPSKPRNLSATLVVWLAGAAASVGGWLIAIRLLTAFFK
jgi:hypothetical protein